MKPVMRWPFRLKLSITQKIGILLVLPVVASAIFLGYFNHYVQITRSVGRFVDVAGRQRMLAVEIREWARMVANGQDEDRAGLAKRTEEFNRSLVLLQNGGRELKLESDHLSTRDGLARVAERWALLQPDLISMTTLPRQDARFAAASKRVLPGLPGLKEASEQVVTAYLSYVDDLVFDLNLVFLGLSLVMGCVFLAGSWLAWRCISGPIRELTEATKMFDAGNFSHAIRIKTGDEVETLANAFNSMAARVAGLVRSLQTSETRLRLAFENSRDALMTLAPPSWQFTSANAAAIELFGARDEADFISRGPAQYSPEWQPDGVASGEKAPKMIEAAMRDGSNFFEWTHKSLSGQEFYATVLLTRIEISGETYLHATVRDESERKRLQASMIQSDRMAGLGEMAGGIAHEINSPLASILLNAELLMDKLVKEGTPEASWKGLVESIIKTTQRIAKISHSLKKLARNAEQDPCSQSTVLEIVEDTLSFCIEKIRIAGIEFRLDREVLPTVQFQCRPTQICQVLMNLIGNACDAIGSADIKWIEVRARQQGENLLIMVRNSGPPIPQEIREKLFRPFFTTKTVGKGTGIGLSISSNILRAHHGRLFLNPDSPETEFVLELPLRQPNGCCKVC